MPAKIKRPRIKKQNNTCSPDTNADKTGTDTSADHTQLHPGAHPKFDKPNKETNPDHSGKDSDADHTTNQQSIE